MSGIQHKTILLVEDEVLMSLAEQATLVNYGYDVVSTVAGEEAVAIVKSDPGIDLVLMDINLGEGIDGTESAKQILSLRNLPLIFLSSHVEREIVEKTEGITSYGYIVKNSGETVLIASIKMAFKLFDAREKERAKEEALVKSEQKHRHLFETMTQGVVYQSADGEIISVNPAAERILGLSLDQISGKTSMDPRWKMIDEEGLPVAGENHPAMVALKSGRTTGPVVRGVYVPEHDSYVWLEITAIPLFDAGESRPSQVYTTFNDITERRKAQMNYKMLFHEMLDAVALHEIILDEAGNPVDYRFLDVNPAFEQMTGLSAKDVIGKTVLEILPDTEKYWIETYGRVALTGEPCRFVNYASGLNKSFQVTAYRPVKNQFVCIFVENSVICRDG